MTNTSISPCLDLVDMADTRRTFHCPDHGSAEDIRCVKIRNPDLTAPWDFLLILIRHIVADSSLISHIVPLEHGGYRRFVNRIHSREVQKIHSLESYESESLSFGFVQLAKSKTRKLYREIRRHLFLAQGHSQEFDAINRPLGPPVEIDESIWPDLPGDNEISEMIRALGSRDLDAVAVGPLETLSLGVHFPTVDDLGDGDFEVSDGEVFSAGSRTAGLSDGIVIETSFQEGIPALATHDYFPIRNGKKQPKLFGDRCAQNVIKEVVTVYKRSQKNGFFRSKQKLKIIRDELRINTFTWTST